METDESLVYFNNAKRQQTRGASYLITDYHIRKIAPLTVNFWTYKAESCNPNLPSLPENMSPKYILATSSYRSIEILIKEKCGQARTVGNRARAPMNEEALVTEYGHLLF